MSARTYRAGTMREALALVRRDLGGNAVILGTREVRRRRLFGLGIRDLVEVTAAQGATGHTDVRAVATPSEPTAPGGLHAQFDEQLRRLHTMVEGLSRQGRI